MKYQINILISILLLNVILLNGQSKIERLYLLMASSKDHLSQWDSETLNPETTDTTRPSVLYLFDRGGIKSIDTINFNHKMGSIMSEFSHFDEFKFLYIREQGLKGKWISDKSGTYYFSINEGNYVSILDYSGDAIVMRKANADSISLGCDLRSGRRFIRNGNLYLSFSKCENQIPYNLNIINKNLEIEELGEQTFTFDSYCRAEASPFSRMGSNGGFPFNKIGELVLSFSENIDLDLWKKVYFQYPYKVDAKKYSNINFLMKTPACNKEVLYKRLYSGATDSIAAYYIYDKNTKRLDSMSTHFNILGMNLYKDYFGFGTLILNPTYSKNKTKDMPTVSRYSNKYGPIPNLQYNTGKFFIWDLNKNDFKTYSFDDIDTELLSIHEDWVYFRIYDEIRRIKLSDLNAKNYKQKTELLYKDKERVPHIHHVFWAPEMPLKVEYVEAKR